MGLLLVICLNLLILAIILWIVAMALEMVVAAAGLPPQVRPIILALVGLFGLLAIFSGYRISWL